MTWAGNGGSVRPVCRSVSCGNTRTGAPFSPFLPFRRKPGPSGWWTQRSGGTYELSVGGFAVAATTHTLGGTPSQVTGRSDGYGGMLLGVESKGTGGV